MNVCTFLNGITIYKSRVTNEKGHKGSIFSQPQCESLVLAFVKVL